MLLSIFSNPTTPTSAPVSGMTVGDWAEEEGEEEREEERDEQGEDDDEEEEEEDDEDGRERAPAEEDELKAGDGRNVRGIGSTFTLLIFFFAGQACA